MLRPQCTVLAGPNGSGKSSIYEKMQRELPGEFINADNIARELRTSGGDAVGLHVRAGRIAIEQVTRNIEERRSFVFETTLSSRHALRVLKRAREAGFDVNLVYVILDSWNRSLDRIELRVRGGGHHIPDVDVIRRYENSLKNLAEALRQAQQWIVIDNSPKVPLVLFEYGAELMIRDYDVRIALHRRLRAIVRDALPDEPPA
jgi:predicted ABC-type ATPase